MKIKHFLNHNKTALALYKNYRKLYLQRQNKKIYFLTVFDTKSPCYMKGNIFIFSKDEILNVVVKFNDRLIRSQYHSSKQYSHKYPGYLEYEVQLSVIGFPEFEQENKIAINVVTADSSETQDISLTLEFETSKQLLNLKKEKLERIKDILICPLSKDSVIDHNGYFETEKGSRYQKNKFSYNFLPQELVASFKIIDTYNISSHDNSYIEDQILMELKQKGVDQPLILDCGAGLKPVYKKEVINLEIVDYPTTDVIGVNEKLPFKDNSFDAVFSAAVLEHVKDPFASAKEICRVLKPGGILMAFVPFLQPYHGYPHHYYNMTISGIRNLFDEEIQIKEVGTNHHPLDLIPWYISSYTSSLSKRDKDVFLNLKLKDFQDMNKIASENFYKNISQQTHEELAFVVKAVGYKK